jgi:hypothetical protein
MTYTPGQPVQARYDAILARLDTEERKTRAWRIARISGNLSGGRPSDNLHDAVTLLLRKIANGTEDSETYEEAAVRADHERQAAEREARLGQARRIAGAS